MSIKKSNTLFDLNARQMQGQNSTSLLNGMSSSNAAVSSKKSGLNQGSILVVDDEKFNCDIIEGFLMILGFDNR